MENRFRYDGKRALVVGCYSGMGEATAKIVQLLFRNVDLEGADLGCGFDSRHVDLRSFGCRYSTPIVETVAFTATPRRRSLTFSEAWLQVNRRSPDRHAAASS